MSYGNIQRLIGAGAKRLTFGQIYPRIVKVLGLNIKEFTSKFLDNRVGVAPQGQIDTFQRIVNNHYGCVIREIRDASKFHMLGQNYPNPF